MEIMTIALFAVLSGADGFVAIETYGKAIAAVVGEFFAVAYGIPSHDTFARVFAALGRRSLRTVF